MVTGPVAGIVRVPEDRNYSCAVVLEAYGFHERDDGAFHEAFMA